MEKVLWSYCQRTFAKGPVRKVSHFLTFFVATFFIILLQFGFAADSSESNTLFKEPLSQLGKLALSSEQSIQERLPRGWPKSGLLVFPEAGRQPWIDAIKSAQKSINMAAYQFSDPVIAQEVLQAHQQRGIVVNLLIEPETFQHDKSEDAASPVEMLKKNRIKIFTPSSRFKQTHHKMILIDHKWAIIGSGNLDVPSFDGIENKKVKPSRDFAITVTHPLMVKELCRMFAADIAHKEISPKFPQLVWGPDTQRSIFLQMINSAQMSIRIYQQDIQDVEIVGRIVVKARSGLVVEVIMSPFSINRKKDKNIPNQRLIQQAGGKIYLHVGYYVHANLMIIDGDNPQNRLMYIGSCNFCPPSLDQTRELGVLTSDPLQIAQVNKVFDLDIVSSELMSGRKKELVREHATSH